MSVDLAVATPTFLDLTFVGLEGMPAPGEERFAADLVRSPGGGAITAVGAARLGLSTALAAPLGEDDAGDFVRAALQRDGMATSERRSPRTPTTVVMPVDGDRSMITVDPGVRASAADVARLEPRAVALSLDQLYCVPPGAAAYVTCGDDDARAFARRPPAKLAGARALFVSQREALTLTEQTDVEAAAEVLGPERGARHRHARRRRRHGARRGPQHARARRSRRPRSTRPAPAICSWPPTSGATCAAPRPRNA